MSWQVHSFAVEIVRRMHMINRSWEEKWSCHTQCTCETGVLGSLRPSTAPGTPWYAHLVSMQDPGLMAAACRRVCVFAGVL